MGRRTCLLSASSRANFTAMSTLAEIEQAIQTLPPEQWTEIRRWMDSHVPMPPRPERVDWSKSSAMTSQRDKGRVLAAGEVSALFDELRG